MPVTLKSTVVLSLSMAALHTTLAPAIAAQEQRFHYSMPEQPLAQALSEVAVRSGRSIVAPAELVGDRTAPAISGEYSLREVIERLIVGSGLSVRQINGALVIQHSGSADSPATENRPANEIVVTGSRIRGAPVASPVIRIDDTAIRDSGFSELGEVARSVPQSFGGGQNPGVGFNVPSSTGGNVGGGSSFNLRGLGSDATLTILNGRRLPYDSARQGIDISAIPLAAVDRIEIVADGASALYGSDAVGGVVNVILKRDFVGVETRARLGRSMEGGNGQRQFGAIVGSQWVGGGGFVTYEFNDTSAITAEDRTYAAARPGLTLQPSSRRHAIAISSQQRFDEQSSGQIDLLYNQRGSATTYPLNFAGDLSLSRTIQSFDASTFAIGGGVTRAMGHWQIEASGSYGTSRTEFRGDSFSRDELISSSSGRYQNRSFAGELTSNGPIFDLPSGSTKLAIGLGFRRNDFSVFRGTGDIQNINARQDILYAFGELSAPLVSPDMEIPLVRSLNVSGAVRYERYRGIASIATPKLGLIYSPAAFVDLKASWGRSFRAPSFIQQFQVSQALLYPVAIFGGAGFPPGSNALLVAGGNEDLLPERARSWSLTLALHPPTLPGLGAEIGYFSTRYIDRIVNPIPFLSQALSNPIYRDRITADPTVAELASIIRRADQFLNLSGAAYDPATVVALVNATNVNAGRQSVHGFDALVRYQTERDFGSVEFALNGSYLRSEQQLSPALPVQQLAGRLFNPPHWRGRAMAKWANGSLSTALTLSYLAGVTDTRQPRPIPIEGMTTVDLTARYRFEQNGSLLDGVELSLAALNIFNVAPDTIATTVYYDTPFDSTNYSPVGRFIAFGLSKKW